ncbi:hypothetical protein ACJZ2D_004887 [Fusarium nematophilum]
MSASMKRYYHKAFTRDARPLTDDQPTTSQPSKCRHRAESSPEACESCKVERKAQLKYRWKIILGLFLPFAISALDVTIIASALPWIANDFNELSQLNWIISAGYLTNTNWRWCFGITLPIGVAGCIIVWVVLRKELLGPQPIPQLEETAETGRRTTFKQRLKTIDIGGQFLSLFGFGLLILGFTWAGSTYAWDSPAILVPLIAGFFIICGFVWWQYHMTPGRMLAEKFPRQQAMIPWEVLRNRDIGLLFYTSFAAGMAMYSVLYFCTLYFTMVKQMPPNEAGRQLLYFVPGIGTGVCIAIYMCNSYPGQTWHPIMLGAIVEAAGIAILAWALWKEHDPTVYGMMVLTGVGVGVRFMPVPLHGMAYFPKRIAAVISLSEVSDPFGGTLGLTIMTTVLNNVAGVGDMGDSTGYDFSMLTHMGEQELEEMKDRAKKGIVFAYIAIFPFMVLCIVASAFLGNVYINSNEQDGDEQSNTIYQGVYLWAWLRGKKIDENSHKVTITRRATWRGEEQEMLPRTNN